MISAPAKPAISATMRRIAHHLAQQQHRAHGDEERRSEAQCRDGAERRDRHRIEEHHHGRNVDRAACGMERQLARAQGAEAVAHQERRNEDQTKEIAEERDFEGMLLARRDADHRVHRREADGGPQQQQHAARRRRQGVVGGEQRRERPGPRRLNPHVSPRSWSASRGMRAACGMRRPADRTGTTAPLPSRRLPGPWTGALGAAPAPGSIHDVHERGRRGWRDEWALVALGNPAYPA